jgi:hypothetical protein
VSFVRPERKGIQMLLNSVIVLDRWVENLRCSNCGKTGAARLSQADGWNAHVDSVSEGFKVIQSGNSSNFYCDFCDRAVEP